MKNLLFILLIFCSSCCSYFKTTRSKNIPYNQNNSTQIATKEPLKLNVFAPRQSDSPKEVLLFIHGGSWNSGNKNLYSFFGNRMAAKGIVTVTINYTHSPKATYAEMALEAAQAVHWIRQNISKYGGDSTKIFVSGHSAGGHLAALIAVDNRYFYPLKIKNPIKGVILIDGAGLDMYSYLKENNSKADQTYLETFTTNPKIWKDASALYHLKKGIPPFLQLLGEKTYPSLISSNNDFHKGLLDYYPTSKLIVQKNKTHVGMMTQFIRVRNKQYGEVIGFMKKTN
jgi:acetyl esterase/lipase